MSFQLALSKTSISADCNTLVITDTTGNAPGVPTGYGAPNPARNTLYLNVLVSLRLVGGRQTIPFPAYNYNTASTWTITLAQDGWYEIFAFATLAYNIGTTYNLGDITYDIGTNTFYKSLQAANIGNAIANPLWWAPTINVEDFIAAINNSQANAYTVTLNDVELCRSTKCMSLAIIKQSQNCACEDNDPNCKLKPYEEIRLKIESATALSALQDYTNAQCMVIDLQKLCQKFGFGPTGTGCGCG